MFIVVGNEHGDQTLDETVCIFLQRFLSAAMGK